MRLSRATEDSARPIRAALLMTTRAKASLLTWADESDERAIKERARSGSVLVAGGLALAGGLLAARVLTRRTPKPTASATGAPEHRASKWWLLARAALWLLPIAARTLGDRAARRSRA